MRPSWRLNQTLKMMQDQMIKLLYLIKIVSEMRSSSAYTLHERKLHGTKICHGVVFS